MDSVTYSCMQPGRGRGPKRAGIHAYGRNIVENDVSVIERRLERRIMGEEYDSVLLGKKELEKSQWLKAHERSEEFASVID